MGSEMWNAMAEHREAILEAAGDNHEKAGRALRTLADLFAELKGGYVPLARKRQAVPPTPPHPIEEALRVEAALLEEAARARQGEVEGYAEALEVARTQAEGTAGALRLLVGMASWEA